MPDQRKHRGQHPRDAALFSEDQIPRLRQACRDLSWLWSHGYPESASLKLVGDRYRLQQRQRLAVGRCACSRHAAALRKRKMLTGNLSGRPLMIDGFNLIITVESALSGGLIFEGLDGCYRDIAGIHGSYKRVEETHEALRLAGSALAEAGAGEVKWLLDRPVSNSGKLLGMLYETAVAEGWNWQVELCFNPDQELIRHGGVVVSSDSAILDQTQGQWLNLSRLVIDRFLPSARVLRLG